MKTTELVDLIRGSTTLADTFDTLLDSGVSLHFHIPLRCTTPLSRTGAVSLDRFLGGSQVFISSAGKRYARSDVALSVNPSVPTSIALAVAFAQLGDIDDKSTYAIDTMKKYIAAKTLKDA